MKPVIDLFRDDLLRARLSFYCDMAVDSRTCTYSNSKPV